MEYHIRIKRLPKKVESLPNEVWKNTIYEKYMVSNYGRIKSIPIGNKHEKIDEHLLTPSIVKGYYSVVLYANRKFINKPIHRLIAETFLDNPNNYNCINHKDKNKLNNNVENLEWCSYSHNSSWSLSKPINKIDIVTKKILATYESAIQACKDNNISKNCNNNILDCCNRRRLNTYKGFIWRFVGDTDYSFPLTKPKILQYDMQGNFIKEYNSVKEAAFANNIKPCGIYMCLENKSRSSNNYIWKYYG